MNNLPHIKYIKRKTPKILSEYDIHFYKFIVRTLKSQFLILSEKAFIGLNLFCGVYLILTAYSFI